MYLLRWIRLLFVREFRMPQLLLVWDALFALGSSTARPGGGRSESFECVLPPPACAPRPFGTQPGAGALRPVPRLLSPSPRLTRRVATAG